MTVASPTVQPVFSFAGLLRQLRAEARLTQEELAEKTGLSPRSISDLERGVSRTARMDTALLLASALAIGEPARAAFVAAARGKGPVSTVLAARDAALGGVPAVPMVCSPHATERPGSYETKLLELIYPATATPAERGAIAGIWIIELTATADIDATAFVLRIRSCDPLGQDRAAGLPPALIG